MTRSTTAVVATHVALPAPASTPGSVSPLPIRVAGVTGGVGTRTLTRLLAPHRAAAASYLTQPLQPADVLVTSITAAAAAWLPVALRHLSTTPVLAVVHTVPGPVPPATRARLRATQPHVRHTVHLPHIPAWTAIETPPDGVLPRRARRARDQLLAATDVRTPFTPQDTGKDA